MSDQQVSHLRQALSHGHTWQASYKIEIAMPCRCKTAAGRPACRQSELQAAIHLPMPSCKTALASLVFSGQSRTVLLHWTASSDLPLIISFLELVVVRYTCWTPHLRLQTVQQDIIGLARLDSISQSTIDLRVCRYACFRNQSGTLFKLL